MEARGKPYFVFIHSPNGYAHANKLAYKNISLNPIDFFTTWAILFSRAKPAVSVINRHEFWPGFVIAASFWSKLYVINAVQKDKRKIFEGLFEKWVYRNSWKVFFVNNIKAFAKNELQAGDTRMDRLKQRFLSEQGDCEALKRKYRNGTKSVLVMGNAYADDVSVLTAALDKWPELLSKWNVLIIPSRPEMVGKMTEMLSEVKEASGIHLIPVMGKLFQYYSCADLAWVGGGFSPNGIHNTLEPSFFNVRLISGPNLDKQPDAIMFKERKFLTTFDSVEELHKILSTTFKPAPAMPFENMSPTSLILNEIYQS